MTPDEIRELRESLDYSLQDMANRLREISPLLGVDRVTVYRWEHGRQAPNRFAVAALEELRAVATRDTTRGPKRKGGT